MEDNNFKFEQILEIASLLNHETTLDEMLRLISVKTVDLFECDMVTISVLNKETNNSVHTVFRDKDSQSSISHHLVNSNISGWVYKNKTSFFSNDLQNDVRFAPNLFNNCGIFSAVGTMLFANDEPIGVLLLMNKTKDKLFIQDDIILSEKLAAVISPFVLRIQEVHNYYNCSLPEEDLIKKYSNIGLIGRSFQFINLLKSIESAAKCDVRVLLEGETGSGKELIAKAIHTFSKRANQKFVVLDCASIPQNLIESELFGHVKGAFTGAVKERIGILEEADNGTLFIDEVNHLPPDMQIKFLRFLQEKEFRPIGSNKQKKSDVRVIAASSSSLSKLVKNKEMREELFYRLNIYPIHVPSLNDRAEDITLLSNYFIKKFASQQNKKAQTFNTEITRLFLNHNWSGNIRELQNMNERLVTLTPAHVEIISKEVLPKEFFEELNSATKQTIKHSANFSLSSKLNEIESQLITEALVMHEWNQSKAAGYLNILEQTLRYKMHKFNIERP